MSILKNSSNEYYITMRDNTDLDSLDAGLNKLIEDEDDNPAGIIIDFDNTEFDAVLSGMSDSFKRPNKEIHIYITVENDTEENWKTIGNTLGMSLLDLHRAKKLVTKIYCANFEDMPDEDSLWDEPLPDAKLIEDYHGTRIKLSRMDQLREDEENFFTYDWLDECLLFYMSPDKDITELLQNVESLLLQTEEVK